MEALQTHPSVYEWIMSTKQVETNDVNGSWLTKQGLSSSRRSWQRNIVCHHANPVISKRRRLSRRENKVVMEWYLLSECKVRGYRKRMLSLWLNKVMFWVSEQRLVYQPNAIRRNSWMIELEVKELERNLVENDSYKGKKEVMMIQVVT